MNNCIQLLNEKCQLLNEKNDDKSSAEAEIDEDDISL